MKHNLHLISVFVFLLSVTAAVNAQNHQSTRTQQRESVPGLGRNSLLININANVIEENTVIWNQSDSKNTIPGRPVGINLVGANVVVAVQFTPFIRRGSSVLVAQGQIWLEDPDKGINYYTWLQTIPMEFGEPIHFYPLGNSTPSNASIEIILTVNPYNDNSNEN